jgi:hypothetical protein
MRVTWVHPSWRDLVIEHLTSHDHARVRFLRDCSPHGAQLALSYAGGPGGDRALPLLKRDQDWDALADRAYELVSEVEPGELVALLDAIADAIRALAESPVGSELGALASAVVTRQTSLWNASRQTIPLPALEAWLALANLLSPRPPAPDLATTWVELLPTSAPDPSDRLSLERFGDWLTLAMLLHDYDPAIVRPLGIPSPARRFADAFLDIVARDLFTVDGGNLEPLMRALAVTARLFGDLEEPSQTLVSLLRAREQHGGGAGIETTTIDPPSPWPRRSGRLDVERVLLDLF